MRYNKEDYYWYFNWGPRKTKMTFLDKGLFGYNYSYLLRHPWIVVRESYYRLKWFMQRGYRGYADCDAWDLDSYLSKWLPAVLRGFKEGPGVPMELVTDFDATEEMTKEAQQTWHLILEDMAQGFEAAKALENFEFTCDGEQKLLEDKVEKGLRLFTKYYFCLWN